MEGNHGRRHHWNGSTSRTPTEQGVSSVDFGAVVARLIQFQRRFLPNVDLAFGQALPTIAAAAYGSALLT